MSLMDHPHMVEIQPSFGRRDPDARGYYGEYGGRFVPETLVAPVEELERAYLEARQDPAFVADADAAAARLRRPGDAALRSAPARLERSAARESS